MKTAYHYEGLMGRVKSFDNHDKTRLYADFQTVMGGFREEKTGERSVLSLVARAREDVYDGLPRRTALIVDGMGRPAFDLPEDRVREYIRALRNQAKEQQSEQAED